MTGRYFEPCTVTDAHVEVSVEWRKYGLRALEAVHRLKDSLQLNFAVLLNSLLSATVALTPVQ